MLDKAKLIAQLYSVADQLFVSHSGASLNAFQVWQNLIKDELFLAKIPFITNAPWPIPLWYTYPAEIVPIPAPQKQSLVVSVDGSQIYPDRHNVMSCCLINIGSIVLPYNMPSVKVECLSEPTIFVDFAGSGLPFTQDSVNGKRQELELAAGLLKAQALKSVYEQPVLLFDGSLIFWHLASQEEDMRMTLLHSYFQLLDQMHQENLMTAWYISLPKSKELMNLVRTYMCDGNYAKAELYAAVEPVVDAHLMDYYLPEGYRTTIFCNTSSICVYYPSYLRPCFFYINNGVEIGRVEIPQWIAQRQELVDTIASVIMDQCSKGGGYPVALAEAHEQAVVKGPDRDFFYHFLQKMVIEKRQKVAVSRKSLKKRGIGI